MLDRVAEFIARHRMLEPGQRVGVAVSGGADSVFLLHALRELAPGWDLRLSVIHIEHGIRGPASVADAEFVGRLAGDLGLPFHVRQADVPAMDGNLEQAARNVRQAFYADLIASRAVDRVATGHTRTDQAETVLYRILRGSGLAGLSGILPVTREGLIRPLLEIDRNEIEAWLRQRGIAWREDETNRDRTYARNRLRHEILPLLPRRFNPQLDQALANMATLARDEEMLLGRRARRHHPPTTSHQPLVLPVAQLTDSTAGTGPPTDPPGCGNRQRGSSRDRFRARGTGAGDGAIAGRPRPDAGARVGHLPVVRLDPNRCAPTPRPGRAADFSIPLQIPGSVELPGSGTRIVLQVLEKDACSQSEVPCAKVVDELDWQRFRRGDGAPGLELRNWRPGDQYRRVGQSKPEKVKFFFQEARIPLWERGNWPIITYAGKIVWARRFGAAAEFATGPETRSVLQVAETGR